MMSEPKNRFKRIRESKAAFLAGACFAVAGMFYVGSTVYGLLSDHISMSIEELLPATLSSNTLPAHMNAFTYEDKKIGSPWAMTVRGKDTLTGTVKARGATGLIHGYFRNGTVTLQYANADPTGPGYGQYFLRRVSNISGVAWVGTVVFHSCDEVNGIQCESNRLKSCPVIVTEKESVDPALSAQYFKGDCDRQVGQIDTVPWVPEQKLTDYDR